MFLAQFSLLHSIRVSIMLIIRTLWTDEIDRTQTLISFEVGNSHEDFARHFKFHCKS